MGNTPKNLSIMALSAPHWIKRAAGESMGLNSPMPFSLQNAVRVAAQRALEGTGALGHSNWANVAGLRESVLLMEHWENERDTLERTLRTIHPDILLVGAMTPSFPGAIQIASLAKKVLGEDVFIMLGGKHVNETFFEARNATALLHAKGSPLRLMEEGTIPQVFDMVCSGRCEELIAAVAERIGQLLREGQSTKDLYKEAASLAKTVPGDWRIGWLEGGAIRDATSTKRPLDVGSLPAPAPLFGIRGAFDVFGTDYTAHAFSDTSAGCVFNCFFCSERSAINDKMQESETAANRLLRQFKAIKKTAQAELNTDSVSVFVEDSTLLGTGKHPDQLLRLAELMKLDRFSIPFGGQFTIDQLDDPAIQRAIIELKTVGLSYVFAGIETADEDIAQRMSKNVHKQEPWCIRNERVIAFMHRAGLRYGVSVLFGLGETQGTRIRQLRQLQEWQEKYSLPSVVSMNLATKHPLQVHDGTEEDFTEWGVAPDSPYLERFQRVFSEASVRYASKPTMLPTLAELQEIEELYGELCLKQSKRSADFYFDDRAYGEYLEGEKIGVHFNSACMSAPSPAARDAAAGIIVREDDLPDEERTHIIAEARTDAASLVGLPASEASSVVLARNTTEAASMCFWLAGLQPGDHVLLSDAENLSIRRIFERHMDHGNPRREDYWSAWATHYATRGPRYEPFKQSTTGVTTTSLLVLDADDNEIERSVREQIDADTKVFVFSHVLRTTGRELPVRKLCDVARAAKAEKNPNHPELFILVDGAQALGNLPRVDVAELGCDAYVATPHKTLRSEVVGILYLNPRSTLIRKNLSTLRSLDPRTQQVILGGMFDERMGVLPNVADALSPADVAGFSAAVRETRANGVEGNDFSRVHERRSALKQYCIERLTALAGESATEIHVLPVENPTSFILPIQIPSKNGKEIARALSDKGMFLSYIEGEPTRTNKRLIRISFQADHTERDVDALIDALRDILAQ